MRANYSYRYDDINYIAKDEQDEIIISIEKVKKALECAYSNFEFVTEPELVDSYIYEVKAMQLKYEYLLHQAKTLGIIVNKYEYTDNKDR